MAPEPDFEEKRLAYDLRAVYVYLTGKAMTRIDEAKHNKDYADWIRTMELLFPTIYSRIDKNRKQIKKKYYKYLKECYEVANKYEDTYNKRKSDPEGIAEIEVAFSKLLHFLYRIMHISNQFGDSVHVKGLG